MLTEKKKENYTIESYHLCFIIALKKLRPTSQWPVSSTRTQVVAPVPAPPVPVNIA
jgi:hypothetical protein